MNCKSTKQELGTDGTYLKSLDQFSSPFSNVDLSGVTVDGGSPPFAGYKGVSGVTYRKGVTFCTTEADVFRPDGTLRHTTFVGAPVEFPMPNNPNISKWVLFFMEKPTNFTDAQMAERLKIWSKQDKLLIRLYRK
jgi:hypothetical protein